MRFVALMMFALLVPQFFLGLAAYTPSTYAYGLEKPINSSVLGDQYEDQQLLVIEGPTPTINREKWKFDLVWPVVNHENISSDYGYRYLPNCSACSTNHKGIDFPGEGELVFAVMDAEVTAVGWEGSFGYRVELTHVIHPDELEYTTIYAHLQESKITEWLQPGMEIPQGQIIGLTGDTGLSTGPHLHFEILENGDHLDPLEFYDYHLK